jgi:hypothetical protein
MNAAEYAKHRNVSKVQVHKYIKAEQITAVKNGGTYEINPAVADAELDRNLNQSKGGRGGGSGPRVQAPSSPGIPSYSDSRAIRERYAAMILKLEFEEKSAKLIDKAELKMKLAKLHMAVRDSLRTIPDRVAPIVAAETDQAKIHAMLLKEIGQALEGLGSAISD